MIMCIGGTISVGANEIAYNVEETTTEPQYGFIITFPEDEKSNGESEPGFSVTVDGTETEEPDEYKDLSSWANISTKKKTYYYTGKEIKPGVVVKGYDEVDGGFQKKILKKFYSVTYKNNKKPGTGSVIITGKNGYYGTKVVKFKIKVKAPKIKSIKASGKTIKVTCKKNKNITGYQIRYKKNSTKWGGSKFKKKNGIYNKNTSGKWKTKTVKSKTGGKLTGLSSGCYYIQVRAYVKINGKKYYSDYSVYDALVPLNKSKADKKNNLTGKSGKTTYYASNYVTKLNKKNGYYVEWLINKSFSINGVKFCTWTAYSGNEPIYIAYIDKNGSLFQEKHY